MSQSCRCYFEELYRQVTPGTMLVLVQRYSVRVYFPSSFGAFDWRSVVSKHRPCWHSVVGGELGSESTQTNMDTYINQNRTSSISDSLKRKLNQSTDLEDSTVPTKFFNSSSDTWKRFHCFKTSRG